MTVVLDRVVINDCNCMSASPHRHGPDGVPELLLHVIFQHVVVDGPPAAIKVLAPCIV